MSYYFYDSKNCLVQISNSILKHFTGECFHDTSKDLDKVFAEKHYDKVALILFDGFGKSIRELHLSPNDYLRRKRLFTISSVFPPTTVAATTAISSGKYPVETGWLGWRQYFKNHNITVDMFTNNESSTGKHLNGPVLSELYCGYTPIWEIIAKHGIQSSSLHPASIDPNGPKDIDEFFEQADILMKKDGAHFYYMYWAEPDKSMHQYGINSPIVKRVCKDINKRMVTLGKENKDNLIIVLSDHSMVDSKYFYIYEHEDLAKMITQVFSLDARSCFFHLKDEYKDKFKETFEKYYGDYFVIKTKEEVIKEKWFGEGTPHPMFEDFLGDYLVTSIKDYGLTFDLSHTLIGNHAGSLKEESLIDVSIINR